MKRIYLDHNATTPIDPAVLAEMEPYFRQGFGNPSSIHWFGQQALRAIDRAREQVAALLGADPSEMVFVSGGTEADNHALQGAVRRHGEARCHVITSAIEHQAVLNTCQFLEGFDCELTYLPPDRSGIVAPAELAEALTPDTILISIMLANNEVGTIQPIREISRVARGKGVLVHTDAVQAIGKIPVQVDELAIDLLSLSGHKIYGPKGIGALYIRKGTKISPIIFGGHHERHRRAGTENVAAIVGLGAACELARKRLDEDALGIAKLRDRLEAGLLAKIAQARVNGHQEKRLPNTLNMSFPALEAEALLFNLDLHGIAVSTGSACISGSQQHSHVLTAMGMSASEASASIRFSLGRENTEEEIDQTIETLVTVADQLRALSD